MNDLALGALSKLAQNVGVYPGHFNKCPVPHFHSPLRGNTQPYHFLLSMQPQDVVVA